SRGSAAVRDENDEAGHRGKDRAACLLQPPHGRRASRPDRCARSPRGQPGRFGPSSRLVRRLERARGRGGTMRARADIAVDERRMGPVAARPHRRLGRGDGLDDGVQLRGFERLFTAEPRDRFVAAATDAIATYVRRLEIDRPFVPVLLVLTWIARALDRLARYGGGSAPPNDPACTRYQQYVDILARRVDYLFDVARHA